MLRCNWYADIASRYDADEAGKEAGTFASHDLSRLLQGETKAINVEFTLKAWCTLHTLKRGALEHVNMTENLGR